MILKAIVIPNGEAMRVTTEAFKITSGVQNPLGTSEDYINHIVSISNQGTHSCSTSQFLEKNSSNENIQITKKGINENLLHAWCHLTNFSANF